MNATQPRRLTDKRMRVRSHLPVIISSLLLAWSSQAAWVNYIGADLNTGGAWRTPTVIKPLDGNADNLYGSDGYLLATSPNGDLAQNPSYATAARLAIYGYYGGDQTNPHYLLLDNPSGG